MKTKTKILSSFMVGAFLTLALVFSSVSSTKSKAINEVFASSSQTITITGTAFTENDENQTATFGDYEFKGKVKKYDKTAIWFTSGAGYLYNTTDLGSIIKLTLSYKSGGSPVAVQRFSFDNAAISSFKSSGGKTVSTSSGETTYDETGGVGYGFFNISVSSKNLQLNSLVVEFIPKSTAILQDIEVSGTPTKTAYYVGESFNSTGLTVEAVYDDESRKDVTNDCLYTPNPLTLGTTDILVSYTEEGIEKTSLLEGIITVSQRNLVSLEITTYPSKITYIVGESFDPAGMVIKANYDIGDPVTDYKGYDYSPKGALYTPGSQIIKISDLTDEVIYVNLVVIVSEQPPIEELFFSEYIEGSSNNKAVEIYNGTGSVVDLSNYKVKVFANGASTTSNPISLSGTLAHEGTFVIVNDNSSATLKNLAQLITNYLSHNGDDAIGLYKNDVLIDLIGIIGKDPGTQWTGTAANGSGSTLDKTLVRTETTHGPNTTFTWGEWYCYPNDTFTYLGSHIIIAGASPYSAAIAYGETFLSETSAGCTAQDLSIIQGVWESLKTQYLSLGAQIKDYFKSLTPNESGSPAEHALARYSAIIYKYTGLDNFMVDSLGNYIFPVNQDAQVSAINYPKIIAIILILVSITFVSGTYLIVRKKHKHN